MNHTALDAERATNRSANNILKGLNSLVRWQNGLHGPFIVNGYRMFCSRHGRQMSTELRGCAVERIRGKKGKEREKRLFLLSVEHGTGSLFQDEETQNIYDSWVVGRGDVFDEGFIW